MYVNVLVERQFVPSPSAAGVLHLVMSLHKCDMHFNSTDIRAAHMEQMGSAVYDRITSCQHTIEDEIVAQHAIFTQSGPLESLL